MIEILIGFIVIYLTIGLFILAVNLALDGKEMVKEELSYYPWLTFIKYLGVVLWWWPDVKRVMEDEE